MQLFYLQTLFLTCLALNDLLETQYNSSYLVLGKPMYHIPGFSLVT